jgi:hypothetical protein
MTQSGPSTEFAVQDISVDREGRITITNPRIFGRLHAAAAVKTPTTTAKPRNINCAGCNTTEGCGPLNKACNPTNTVPNCGCTKK